MNPDVSIERSLSRGWQALAAFPGPILVGMLIVGIIDIIADLIPGLNVVYNLFFAFPLFAGLILMHLKAVRGTEPRIGDMFSGFNDYFKWLGIGWLLMLVGLVVIAPTIIAIFAAGMATPQQVFTPKPFDLSGMGGLPDISNPLSGHLPMPFSRMPSQSQILTVLVGLLISLIVAGILMVRWLYVFFAGHDGAGVLDAFGESAALTRGRLFHLSWIYFALGIVVLVGAFFCGIGMLFTALLAALAHASIYDDLRRGSRQWAYQSTPPPVLAQPEPVYSQPQQMAASSQYPLIQPQPQPEPAGPPNLTVTRLTITGGPHLGEVFPLTSGPVTIGRDATCAISLMLDGMVSRQHATLTLAGSTWHIQDTGSTNGTYLNGQRITTADLQPGDVLQVGQTMLKAM